MTYLSITHEWLDAQFRSSSSSTSLHAKAVRFLRMKIGGNEYGLQPEEMISDYYLIATHNDRLKTRLERDENGVVVCKSDKPVTASSLALYAFNVMFDQLDKSARKNLDIARMWDVTSDADKAILKTLKRHYDSPTNDLFEAVCAVSDDGVVSYELCDTSQSQPDDGVDRLSEIEKDALIKGLARLTAKVRKSGTVMKDAEATMEAMFDGCGSADLADILKINQGNARVKLNTGEKVLDYFGNIHRQAHAILTRKSNGGRIGGDADPVVVELMITKGWLTSDLQLTDVGRAYSTMPIRPSVFKESLSYWLLDLQPNEDTTEDIEDALIPDLYLHLMK